MSTGYSININENITEIQSPHLYLQAAGSTGADSTRGRHLRWALQGALGEKHLPKGDSASNYVNFNKPKDFVKIYRAYYQPFKINLDFVRNIPELVDDSNHLWIYRLFGKELYIHFNNTEKYQQIRNDINPLQNPNLFIENYGSEVIEIESLQDPFFAVTCNFSNATQDSEFKVETLSVGTTNINENKVVSNRKKITDTALNTPLKLIFENGRSVRWQVFEAQLASIEIEFYLDTIHQISLKSGWDFLGKFALSDKDEVAFKQLEPTPGSVKGQWHRFDEEALVNVDNYQDKWSGAIEVGDRNIKNIVKQYIELSEHENNPLALENIALGINSSDPTDNIEISNLDMLNFAAYDYHVARMLGLGMLDIDNSNDKFLYVAEYFTNADLEDGLGVREAHHLFMSLPTSLQDERLPEALDLKNITPGLFMQDDQNENLSLTDEDGYAYDGMSRYVSIYTEPIPEDDINTSFFISNNEFNLSKITSPVYGGLKFRLNQESWVKPELSNDPEYQNLVTQGDPFNETLFINIPEPEKPFYTHRHTQEGVHRYRTYGINWFSRAKISPVELSIETLINQKNNLVPPSNTSAHLIRKESPLLLTSAKEQQLLEAIPDIEDKTLIRLTFDYHTSHELKNYNISLDSQFSNTDLTNPSNANNSTVAFPDNKEIFANEVDVFFRNQVPQNIRGKALNVSNHSSNDLLSVITTGDYLVNSTGETLTPSIQPNTENNFAGGTFLCGENKYIIYQVEQTAQGLVFTVYKKQISDSIVNDGGIPSNPLVGELEAPVIVEGGLFMAVENMLNETSWNTPNPLGFKVKIGVNWDIHREIIQFEDEDGILQRKLEKTRGIWANATITQEDEPIEENPSDPNNPILGFRGLYKIEFNNYFLNQHSQFSNTNNSVEWYKGIVRVFSESAVTGDFPNKTRKVLPVIKILNIENSNGLVLYVKDPSYDHTDTNYDQLKIGNNIEVNFYPGYKVYLYSDSIYGINEENILPNYGEEIRYSIFSLRSRDINGGCDPNTGICQSKISTPFTMYAQELIDAIPPEKPEGSLYATRPDYFGRSTYTLTTEYKHKPNGVLFYRSNDEALLNALYEKETIKQIRESLEILGGNEEDYLSNRWNNFLDFEQLETEGDFRVYPPEQESSNAYKFPNPDKQAFFNWANQIQEKLQKPLITDPVGSIKVGDSKIINYVRGAIYNAFVSLTELPILYKFIKGESYNVVDKPQVVKDANGNILNQNDEDFEMAPMMKVVSDSPHKTLFTDFKLDGTSNNLYFYGAKELSSQMKMSDFSPFLGPIKLVNTKAIDTPEVKRIIPVLENSVLGISAHIKLEINAYPKAQKVKKINIYRAYNFVDAQSVQTMQLVKTIDLENAGLINTEIWSVQDNFEDLTETPFGDALYYRVTVSKKVEYENANQDITVEYSPSQASKIVASLIVENTTPSSPVLKFKSTAPDVNNKIHSVSLKWFKTVYKAKYHIYKMNNQGNWHNIYQIQTNDNEIVLSLAETNLQSDSLKLIDNEGSPIYHHFKVITENTAGMLSTNENILTIFNENDWLEI